MEDESKGRLYLGFNFPGNRTTLYSFSQSFNKYSLGIYYVFSIVLPARDTMVRGNEYLMS